MGDSLEFVEPLYLFDDIPDNDGTHNSGRLHFGLDGCLYATLGDDQDFCAAADSTVLKGLMMRLEVRNLPQFGQGQMVAREDLVPQGNPFPNSGPDGALVFAYGLRNAWSYRIDPMLGTVYLVDVGEQDYEEVNEVEPGDFLGWPWREGPKVLSRSGCPEPGGAGANDFKGPILSYARSSGSTAMLFGLMYRPVVGGAANWPAEYQGFYGSIFYAEYYTGWVRRLKKLGGLWNPATEVPGQPNPTDWATGLTTVVDFMPDRDGSVLWLQQFDDTFQPGTGSVHRIRYAPVAGIPRPGASGGSLSAAPNPFRVRTDLSFTLASAGEVRLSIYDVSGRRVRALLNGSMAAGAQRIGWDGRDDAGRSVAAGV